MERLRHFRHVWAVDFEYTADDGEVPEPVCMAAVDLHTGAELTLWREELRAGCPFDAGPGSLFVVFAGSGDLGVFLELGWPVPVRIVDLYPELRQRLYDRPGGTSPSLLAAAALYGVRTPLDTDHKRAMRDLIIHRAYTDSDRAAILAYCVEDARLTGEVFRAMLPELTCDLQTWNGVLLRGRYTPALARMHRVGVPLDMESLQLASRRWDTIKGLLIAEVDQAYGVYRDGSFSGAAFAAYLERQGIPWPRLPSGALALDDDTFRKRAAAYPQVRDLRELRSVLGRLRAIGYVIGKDGRNRAYLNPYGAVTGRNQPGSSAFIFGSARWARSFIQPPPGRALVSLDYKSQEIGVNAALSGDRNLWSLYTAGDDPYMAFAVMAGLAPPGSTKATHPTIRQQCKSLLLGVGYGMGPEALAEDMGAPIAQARALLQRHRELFSVFWAWVRGVQDAACLGAPIRTPYAWARQVKPGQRELNRRSFQNFPAQASSGDMLRLAVSALTEGGIDVCCPIHDAVLVECDLADVTAVMQRAAGIMCDASELVLGKGYVIRVDASVVPWLGRYHDGAAGTLWTRIMRLARQAEAQALAGDGLSTAEPIPGIHAR